MKNGDVLQTTDLYELLFHDFWGTDISREDSHKSYRPVTVATFRFDHSVYGLEARGFHITNTLIYCVVVISTYFMLSQYLSPIGEITQLSYKPEHAFIAFLSLCMCEKNRSKDSSTAVCLSPSAYRSGVEHSRAGRLAVWALLQPRGALVLSRSGGQPGAPICLLSAADS